MQSEEGSEPNSICIRCALGADEFERPGIPFYTINIWPPTHNSQIIEYYDTFGVTKVLHGNFTLELYNQLVEDPVLPIYSFDLQANDITWFSPSTYKTHRYVNQKSVSCTLQYIKRIGGDSERYLCYCEDRQSRWVTPVADMRFKDLIAFVREEYKSELQDGNEDVISEHNLFLQKILEHEENEKSHVTTNKDISKTPSHEEKNMKNRIHFSLLKPG